MGRLWGFLLSILLMTAGNGQVLAANFETAVSDADKFGYINIFGKIEKGDDEKFHAATLDLIQKGYVIFKVNVFTIGGDVRAAMRIGDQIRMLQTRTVAPTTFINAEKGNVNCWFNRNIMPGYVGTRDQDIVKYNPIRHSGNSNCDCASACFLIWASGIAREGNIVGIHRPYYDENYFAKLSAGDAQQEYAKMLAEYKAYLAKLEVPSAIVERMFATDSKSMHYLDRGELELMTSTPFLEELTHARCGPDRTEHMSARNNWTSTEDIQHINCYRTILNELMQAGSRRFQERGNEPGVIQKE
jgi:hypothetical protein